MPFLDHTLVEFAARIPDRLKIRGGTQKYILKEAVRDLLPREIVHRKKMGFPTPLRQWLLDARAEPLYAALRSRRWIAGGVISTSREAGRADRAASLRLRGRHRSHLAADESPALGRHVSHRPARARSWARLAARRMKILWVNSDFLHPTTRGGQIRTLETLKRLHQRHEIHYVALDLPEPAEGVERSVGILHAKPIRCRIACRAIARRDSGGRAAKASLDQLPLAVRRYRSDALRRQVETLTRREKFDAVVCDFLCSAAEHSRTSAARCCSSTTWRR